MTLVKVLLLLLKVSSALIDYVERRRILKEGELKALNQMMGSIDARLKKAQVARDSVDHSPNGVQFDPNNRDNRP